MYTEQTNKDKNRILFMALGKEGQRQFLSLPEGADFLVEIDADIEKKEF